MHIVIDATTTQNEWKNNGIGVYTRNLLSNLIPLYPKTEFTFMMYDGISTIDKLISKKFNNLNVVRIGEREIKSLLNPVWYFKQMYPGFLLSSALKKIRQKQFLFFSPFFWGGLPKDIPFVVTLHDFALPVFNIYSQISSLHNWVRMVTYWNEMKKVYLANRVIVDANFTKKDVIKYLPKYDIKNVRTIYLACDFLTEKSLNIDSYLPKDWKERKYILYLGGGVTRNKNSNGVIYGYYEFVKRLNIKDVPYLVIAGKNFTDMGNKDVKRIHNLVKDLNLEEFVHFTGYYDERYKYSLLKNATACMHLSLYEGFGIGMLEAMYSGSPTIAHKGSTYVEVMGDGGILLDGENSKEVGDALFRVYTDELFAKELGIKGYLRAKHFSWKRTAKDTYSVFQEVYNVLFE